MAGGWGPPAVDNAFVPKPEDTGWGASPAATPVSSAASTSGWGPPAPQATSTDEIGPMPGPFEALGHGLRQSVEESGQSLETIQGQKPTELQTPQGPEAQGFGWRDLREPSRGLSKLAYQVGESSPTLAGGILGGAAGSMVSPGIGTTVGGISGAGLGAAFQAIGPSFARELKRTPHDPDSAWDRALKEAGTSGVFSGASWAAFPLKFFKGPLKNLAFQAFGIQPGINVAQKATENVIQGEPPTQGLGEAYTQGAVGTAVPALGHLALKGRFGEPETTTTEPTPQQVAQSVQDKQTLAQQLLQQAQQPGLTPQQVQKLTTRANDLNNIATFEADRHTAQQRAPQRLAQADQLEQQANNPALNSIQQATLLEQARTQRQLAREDGFIGSMPPPLTPPAGGLFSRLKESYLNNVDPASRSEAALKADAVITKYKAQRGQLENAIIHRGEQTYAYKWPKVDPADQDKFLFAAETGTAIDPGVLQRSPWMADAIRDYRDQLDLTYKLEKDMGSRAHWLENYFPHIWKDPARAREVFSPENMAQSMGPTWFQKARVYDLIEMGKANGLELRHNNIQDMINSRLMSGEDMINKMEMLHDLQGIGVATPLDGAPPHVLNPTLIGSPFRWDQVTAPNGQKWMLAPDVQSLWKNGVDAKGLWANESGVGDAFRTWMKVKNAWVPIKLGLSAFHFVHVVHINAWNNMNRALNEAFGRGQQGLSRRFAAVPEAMLQTVADTFFALPVGFPQVGKTMRESALTPRENKTASQRADSQLMAEAGMTGQLSEQLKIRAKRDFSDALNNSQYLKTIPAGLRRGLEKMSSWMFEEWIPNLKAAALKRESETLFRRRPDLVTDQTNRRVALRALGKQIDNRFGEMFYGGLFWNRTLKDASIGSFLSLGWNLGFAREFGGGAFEPIVRRMLDAPNPTRKLVRDTTTKTSNMFGYSISAMMLNAVMNKSFTGDNPEGLDYIFPRIGGLNPDGSPRRITNAFYTREVPMAMKNIQERQSVIGGLTQMMYHKMLFQPFVEMAQNKNYFGSQIMDENAPFFQQSWQFLSHLMSDQFSPMSITGANRALELSGKEQLPGLSGWLTHPIETFKNVPDTLKKLPGQLTDRDVVMPFLGFGPAPGYASKSAMQNRIMYDFKRYVAPEEKSFEVGAKSLEKTQARNGYMGAMQRGDKDAQMKFALKLAELGVATKEINKLQPGGSALYMFHRLPAPNQKALLKEMTPEEFKFYYPKAQEKLRADPEVQFLRQRYYRP